MYTIIITLYIIFAFINYSQNKKNSQLQSFEIYCYAGTCYICDVSDML